MTQGVRLSGRQESRELDLSPLVKGSAKARPRHEAQIRDTARLAALHDLNLIGSETQKTIDRLTGLASRLLEVPVSLVTLVEAERQVFLGAHGLDGEAAQTRQTPLSHSFCKHAVSTRRPLVVRDARTDPLLRDNLAVSELGVIAYAGIPLILDNGAAVGAFCAIDHSPRDWGSEDLENLRTWPRWQPRC